MADLKADLQERLKRASEFPDLQAACPYLGLERDPHTHARQPTPMHRCYRIPEKPGTLSEAQQLRLCLGTGHLQCPVYLGADTNSAIDPPRPPGVPDDGARLPAPASKWIERSFLALVAVGLLSGAAMVAMSVLDFGSVEEDPARSEPTVTAPTRSPEPSRETPTAAPTNTSTAEPTPTATPSPTPVSEYLVQPGDSYTSIAEQFGVSLEELLEANGRTLESQLFAGDVLIIP